MATSHSINVCLRVSKSRRRECPGRSKRARARRCECPRHDAFRLADHPDGHFVIAAYPLPQTPRRSRLRRSRFNLQIGNSAAPAPVRLPEEERLDFGGSPLGCEGPRSAAEIFMVAKLEISIGYRVRQDYLITVTNCAAGIDNIWHVALPFRRLGVDEWLARARQNL